MHALILLQLVALSTAPVQVPNHKLVVGTKAIPPFVIENADGTFGGIGIELWKRVAADLKLDYEIRTFEVPQLLNPGANGIDAVVSVNISAKNESTMDLTGPFYSTGLAIATRSRPDSGVGAIAQKILSASFLKGVGVLAVILSVMGVFVWKLERTAKPEEFGGSTMRGIAHGIFWAFESLVGKAGGLSRSYQGRVLALLWTFASVLLISGVTAKLSSELTVNQFKSSITGPGDLVRVKVGTISPSLSSNYLERRQIDFQGFPDARQALEALKNGSVDAVVYEAPILQYQVATQFKDSLQVLPGTFHNHGYGFGLQVASPLRKPINLSLLRIVEQDDWRTLLNTYLGSGS